MRNAVIGLTLLALLLSASDARADPIGFTGATSVASGGSAEDLTPGLGLPAGFAFGVLELSAPPAAGADRSNHPIQGFTPPGLARPPQSPGSPSPATGLALGLLKRAAEHAAPSAAFAAESAVENALARLTAPGETAVTFGPLQPAAAGPVFVVAADPIATPEPASLLLIGSGLAGLAAARRRLRRAPA
jgi:hypothetical protein